MGFEVITSEIKAAAKKLKEAAKEVKEADPSADVSDIATALPGSKSAAKATELSTAWKNRFKGWNDNAVTEANEQIASANTYDASDYQADMRARRVNLYNLQGSQP